MIFVGMPPQIFLWRHTCLYTPTGFRKALGAIEYELASSLIYQFQLISINLPVLSMNSTHLSASVLNLVH